MVRPALKLGLLAGAVLVAHVLVIAWIDHAVDTASALPEMAPAMYTRLLKPAEPPAIVAHRTAPPPARRPRRGVQVAQVPRPPASEPMPEKLPPPEEAPEPSGSELASAQPAPAQAAQAAASAASAAQAASAPASAVAAAPVVPPNPFAQPASEPASAAVAASPAASAPQAAALDSWPTDTRLDYRLTGQFRSGPLYGNANVAWQREGAKYQVKLTVNLQPWVTEVLTSQGQVTPDGLQPHAYEELNPRKRRSVRIGDDVVTLDNGKTAARPAGVQDTASQFVELVHRFATGRETLAVGRSVTVWLARPGGVDAWVYDILDKETLRLPQLGNVEAYHLKPRPLGQPRGDITAEIWFAPSLQYLPVRILIAMGSEAHVDLRVEQIEQR